jgi:hypothetical protein
MSSNVWLDSNRDVIKSIVTSCTEYDLMGAYGGNLPLKHIIRLFNSVIIEIERLQKYADGLQNQNRKLNDLIDKKSKEDSITDGK